jgi:hypothetical protein
MSISKDDLERLLANIRTDLRGATDNAIKGRLFNVIDEFFNNSNSWVEWVDFSIVNGQQDYTITPKRGGMIKRLYSVLDQNCVTYPATITEIEPPGAKLRIIWPQNMTIPVKAIVYKSIVLPTTTDDIPVAPRWLLPMYERAIEAGVIGRMQMTPNVPWANANLGQINYKTFLNQVAEARAAAARGNLRGGQAWRFPRGWGTRSQMGGVSTPFPQPTSWGN